MNYVRDVERGDNAKPGIPAQVVPYGDMQKILEKMNGGSNFGDASWKGILQNVEYVTGPGFVDQNLDLYIESHNYQEYKRVNSVCGYIFGSEEPDRYIIYGNHRDAWAYGAMDPNSGTATILEVAKAFGSMKSWRPKRTLMFCSLAAEEEGLFGSYELVETIQRYLSFTGVVYMNVDTSVSGNRTFSADGSPHTRKSVEHASKLVDNALPGQINKQTGEVLKTLYDNWLDMRPYNVKNYIDYQKHPEVEKYDINFEVAYPTLGSGSDFRPFLQLTGTAAINFSYGDNEIGYPLYHSMYETFYAVSQLVDTDFKCHASIVSVLLELGRNFSDSKILPLDISDYGLQFLVDNSIYMEKFKDKYTQLYQLNMEKLDNLAYQLAEAVFDFQEKLDQVRSDLDQGKIHSDPLYYRKINDVLMNFERLFLNSHGLLGREFEDKHLLYAQSQYNAGLVSSYL